MPITTKYTYCINSSSVLVRRVMQSTLNVVTNGLKLIQGNKKTDGHCTEGNGTLGYSTVCSYLLVSAK